MSDPTTLLLMAATYPVGFIFVIVGRSEFFTEHTTLAVFPVLGGRASVGRLARLADYAHFMLWSSLGNAVGGVVFVAVVKYSHAVKGPAIPPSTFADG